MPKTIFGGAHALFVEALIQARRRAGLNQTELGQRLGKDQKFVSLIERSQRRIDVVEWLAICRALGLEPVELYREVTERVSGPLDI